MTNIFKIKEAIRAELRRQGQVRGVNNFLAYEKQEIGVDGIGVEGILDLDSLAIVLWNTALFGEGKPLTDSEGAIKGWAVPKKEPAHEAGEEIAPIEPVATNDLRFVERRNTYHGHRETILQQRWVGAAGAEWIDVPLVSP